MGVVSSLRERQSWPKIVALTNCATPDMWRRAMALVADAVFDKGRELDGFFACCSAIAPRQGEPQAAPVQRT